MNYRGSWPASRAAFTMLSCQAISQHSACRKLVSCHQLLKTVPPRCLVQRENSWCRVTWLCVIHMVDVHGSITQKAKQVDSMLSMPSMLCCGRSVTLEKRVIIMHYSLIQQLVFQSVLDHPPVCFAALRRYNSGAFMSTWGCKLCLFSRHLIVALCLSCTLEL